MHFYFGNSYLEGVSTFSQDLLVAILATVLGLIGAFWIFRLTINHEKIASETTRIAEQRDAINYFYRLALGSITHIENQYNQISDYINKQRDNLSIIRRIEFVTSNDIYRIKQIDNLLIFKAYRDFFSQEPNWINDFRRIYNNLDMIESIELEIKRLDVYNYNKLFELAEDIKRTIDSLRPKLVLILSSFNTEGSIKTEHQEEFNFLLGVFKKYMEIKELPIDFKVLTNELLQPMMENLNAKYSGKVYFNELMSIGQIGRTQIADFLRTIDKHCTTMEELPERFPNTINNLRREIEKMRITINIE